MKMMQSRRASSIIRNREKEELRRTVAELMAEEMRKMKMDNQKVESLRAKFVENVSLMGLTEAIKSKHRIVKALWVIIFIAGLGATGYFVYRIADEYRRHPTATKISVIRKPSYEFPPVVLCLDTWLNATKVADMGFSREAVAYALRYLMLYEEVGNKLPPSPMSSTARDEFYEAYERNNFTSLVQFFKDIAVDMVLDSKDPMDVAYSCNRCVIHERLEKVVMNTGVCHRLVLNEVDGKLRQSSGLPEFRLRVPDLTDGLVPVKEYWRLYIKPLVRQLISSSPFISIHHKHAHAVKISSQRFDMVDKENDPCIKNDPTVRFDDPDLDIYSSLSCSLTCVCDSMKRLYNCTVLNLDKDFTHSPNEYCNTYYWTKWPNYTLDVVKEKEDMEDCIEKCPHECSVIMYDTMVDTRVSKELVEEENEWYKNGSDKPTLRNAKIYFINAAVLSGGVITYQEVFTYSFETLVGNIGGTCGIWIGVSIMTLIQLFMFCVEQSLRKGAKARLRADLQTYKTDQTEGQEVNLV